MEQNDIMQARKERILAYIRSEAYIPMKRRDLRVMMDVPKEDLPLFEELLQQLIDEGHLFETRKGKLASPKDLQMATGSFIGHARGFGFVTPDEGGDDVFIPASETMGAMQKDKVLYKVLHKAEKGKKADGVIVKILERGIPEKERCSSPPVHRTGRKFYGTDRDGFFLCIGLRPRKPYGWR